MNTNNLEQVELALLTEGIYKVYGYDFRQYAQASFKRRIQQIISKQNYSSISHLLSDIIHNEDLFIMLLNAISVTTSEMFRDPSVFKYIREKIIPYLNTFPHIRIWHAACAGGEEVYSLAIILKEEGIYDHCSIYATDLNSEAIKCAETGIYPIKKLKEYSKNYQKSGGKGTLSDYYIAKYDHALFDKSLLKNVTFSNHNLTTDSVFIEPQLILCRNVLIYFNKELQSKVLKLFKDSLINGGILCLGSKESIQFSQVENDFKCLEKTYKIYKKESTEENG